MFYHGLLIKKNNSQQTCRQLDQIILKKLKLVKIGHAGTLDYNAFGLMLELINHSTQLLSYFEKLDKVYLVKLTFHQVSSTLDRSGLITNEVFKKPRFYELAKFIKKLPAAVTYTLPALSAKKWKGKPLYYYYHKKILTPTFTKTSILNNITVLKINNFECIFTASVKSGTYLRSVCQILAKLLNVSGYMSYLERIQLGMFSLHDATETSDVNSSNFINLINYLNIPEFFITDENYKAAVNGAKLQLLTNHQEIIVKYRSEPIAIYQKQKHIYKIKIMLKKII